MKKKLQRILIYNFFIVFATLGQAQASKGYIQLGVDPFFTQRKIKTLDTTRYDSYEGYSLSTDIGFFISDSFNIYGTYYKSNGDFVFDGVVKTMDETAYGLGVGYSFSRGFQIGLEAKSVSFDISEESYEGMTSDVFIQSKYALKSSFYVYMKFAVTFYSDITLQSQSSLAYDYKGQTAVFGLGRVF